MVRSIRLLCLLALLSVFPSSPCAARSVGGAFVARPSVKVLPLSPLKIPRASATVGQASAATAEGGWPFRASLSLAGLRGGASSSPSVSGSLVPSPRSLTLPQWKVLYQLSLTTLNVLCWYVPSLSSSLSSNGPLLSLFNSFSGGVFLSLALCHLLPECVAAHQALQPAPGATLSPLMRVLNSDLVPYCAMLSGYLLLLFVERVLFKHQPAEVQAGKDSSSTYSSRSSGALVLVAALGVHSTLETLALGLAPTLHDASVLSFSIGLHQPFESLSLLVSLLKVGVPPPLARRYLLLFSLCGPLGVSLGLLLRRAAPPRLPSLLLSLVAGTFLYAAASDVVPEELGGEEEEEGKRGVGWRAAAIAAGAATMLAVTANAG